jgi:hypothetical protein
MLPGQSGSSGEAGMGAANPASNDFDFMNPTAGWRVG